MTSSKRDARPSVSSASAAFAAGFALRLAHAPLRLWADAARPRRVAFLRAALDLRQEPRGLVPEHHGELAKQVAIPLDTRQRLLDIECRLGPRGEPRPPR